MTTKPVTTLRVIQGTKLAVVLQAYNFDSTVPVNYLQTDTLAGKVWLIAGSTALISFTPEWYSYADAQVEVELTEAQTASLIINNTYNLHVFVTRDGETFGVAWTYLEILPAAS